MLRYFSIEILQCKLHDPRILRSQHLPEGIAVEVHRRIFHTETVRDVERLCTKFDLLPLVDLEGPRKSRIELEHAGACDTADADIPKRSHCRQCKRRSIEIVT